MASLWHIQIANITIFALWGYFGGHYLVSEIKAAQTEALQHSVCQSDNQDRY